MSLRLIPSIYNGIWAIDKNYANSYLPLVKNLINGKINTRDLTEETYSTEKGKISSCLSFATFKNGVYQVSEYGNLNSPDNAPPDSIAILNITDVITKYDQSCGPSGMLTKADLLKRLDQNQRVNAIALVIDSGGGEGYASMMMSKSIKSLNTPVFGYVSDLAASAACEILSAAKYCAANSPIAQIGSIGTYLTIMDYRKQLEADGINLIEIYADASVDKNKAYYDALNGDTTLLKEMVNKFNDQFIGDIAQNRNKKLSCGSEVWGTGKLYMADEALKIGLIDEICTFDKFINDIQNGFLN